MIYQIKVAKIAGAGREGHEEFHPATLFLSCGKKNIFGGLYFHPILVQGHFISRVFKQF